MTQRTCKSCGTANNTSDMGYCWKCKASLAPAPGSDATPWPARDVVAKLVEASDILLDEHDYDGHGYELISEARRVARAWLRQNVKLCGGATKGQDHE